MNARALTAVLGLVATLMLVGPGAAAAQVGEEPGPTITVKPVCDSPELSGFNVVGAGFNPSQPLWTSLQVIQDGSLVFFVDAAMVEVGADGTFDITAAFWEGPSTFIVSFFGQGPILVERLFVDCSKPATKQQCKKDGWRGFGSETRASAWPRCSEGLTDRITVARACSSRNAQLARGREARRG